MLCTKWVQLSLKSNSGYPASLKLFVSFMFSVKVYKLIWCAKIWCEEIINLSPFLCPIHKKSKISKEVDVTFSLVNSSLDLITETFQAIKKQVEKRKKASLTDSSDNFFPRL